MHCPSCGQQQVNAQTRYCSRCGLPLALIAEVVAHGGSLPQLQQLQEQIQPTRWFSRRNGVGFSLIWFVFFLLVITPFFGIANMDELAGISAIIAIFGGLIWLLFALFFLPGKPKPLGLYAPGPLPHNQNQMPGYQNHSALPPQQSVPVQNYTPPQHAPQPTPQHVAGSWRDTNDLGLTSDTREEATRMLDKDEQRF